MLSLIVDIGKYKKELWVSS